MARRPPKATPQPPVLNPDQIRRRIDGLQRCIAELEEFDPSSVQKRYNITEIVALETSIIETLAAAFGHGTPRFQLFEDAAKLDQGPHVVRTAPAFGYGPEPNYDAQDAVEARAYLAEGKQRSIQLLQRAIRALENDLEDLAPPASPVESALAPASLSRKVFIVHGHAGEPREAVARFLDRIDLKPIILHEQANQGKTIIEKFEAHADVGFAIILLTPDDVGGPVGGEMQPRARQNVVLELGYFIGRLTRGRVCALKAGDLELPSDVLGVVWTSFDAGGAWKTALAKELQAAGYDIDWNKVMR
jgi:predicted nucleotide-binding protein